MVRCRRVRRLGALARRARTRVVGTVGSDSKVANGPPVGSRSVPSLRALGEAGISRVEKLCRWQSRRLTGPIVFVVRMPVEEAGRPQGDRHHYPEQATFHLFERAATPVGASPVPSHSPPAITCYPSMKITSVILPLPPEMSNSSTSQTSLWMRALWPPLTNPTTCTRLSIYICCHR
jgi:hypothetical protein